jgi:acyl dehydratase
MDCRVKPGNDDPKSQGPAMQEFYVKVGDSVTFAKTVGETDIYLFAGITGDFSVNHVNDWRNQIRPAHRARRAIIDYLSPARR